MEQEESTTRHENYHAVSNVGQIQHKTRYDSLDLKTEMGDSCPQQSRGCHRSPSTCLRRIIHPTQLISLLEVPPLEHVSGRRSNSAKEGRTGLPVGSVPFKMFGLLCYVVSRVLGIRTTEINPTLFYSGLHDQGHLLPPKEHGSLCELLSCVKQAKEFNDDFLTSKLSKNYTADSFGADSKPSKRPRK
eukprot:scaffold1378_cov137-Cylindrotheca_fusiformis.AAC.15